MFRRTKIVTTLGPATQSREMIAKILKAGANVVRLNFSHGDADTHREMARRVREVSDELGLYTAIMGDLQGPKIRIARFRRGQVELRKGDRFILDAELDAEAGDEHAVGIDYKSLPNDCQPGDMLMLDDGRIQLKVTRVDGPRIETIVQLGGLLKNNKGINKLGGGLSAPALTDKDRSDIALAAEIGVDYLAVSFPRSADDIREAETLLRRAGSNAGIIAKIERAEVVNDDQVLDEMILASSAVMVARGDLGVEIGDAELIGVQKKIIHHARHLNRVVITATQMMESMIHSPIPTRAEVFDVANAVLDGTDAVMLSAETATGDYPVEVIQAMSRACLGAEKQKRAQTSRHRIDVEFQRIDEAVAMATMYTANHLKGLKAILCLTESGSTPLWLSRIRSGIPIFALTRREDTLRRVALFRGVQAIPFDPTVLARHDVNKLAVRELEKRGLVHDGDYVILTKGDHMGILGGTNAMKILKVGEIH